MWQNYINAESVEEVLEILSEESSSARIIAGGTDLVLEMERGALEEIHTLVDISRIPGLAQIREIDGIIYLGPCVTHNHCVASSILRKKGFPLVLSAWQVGAPQIRNLGTVAGNLITASPANDTITPLMALNASVTLRSVRGTRTIPLREFYSGFRQTVMNPDEMFTGISFPAIKDNQKGMFVKLGLRRAQAISLVNIAVVLTLRDLKNGEAPVGKVIDDARLTLGAVTPVIENAIAAENYLIGKTLSVEVIEQAAVLAQQSAFPITDVRGSADYRNEMVRICVLRGLKAIANGKADEEIPEEPVLLNGWKMTTGDRPEAYTYSADKMIRAKVNGQRVETKNGHGKTILRWLREDVNLVGTKEGCAEGECGACTIILDGQAVMSCLIPAPRAHGAEIWTIEGLSNGNDLHPVQKAFIDHGAVQCGYCTPGFIMSAAVLLDENPKPSRDEIKQAITGNLCRCTGYYKIIEAISKAV